jgi:hypothetical protein
VDQRYEPHEITYAHMAIINIGGGRIAAGIQLSNRHRDEAGRVLPEPYRVLSMLYAEQKSVRQAIPTIAFETLQAVSRDAKLVIFAGNTKHFMQRRRYEAEVGMYGITRGVDVKFTYKPGIERVIPDLMRLANDSIRRGHSLVASI